MALAAPLRWIVILHLADACGDLNTLMVLMAVMLLAVCSLLLVASYVEIRHETHNAHDNLA